MFWTRDRLSYLTAIAGLVLAVTGCGQPGELIQGEALLVFEGATLIDGTSAGPRQNSAIVIDGARVIAVGNVGDFQYPGDATVLDLAGRWLLPGFMDLHFHIKDGSYQNEVLETLLQFGITTFRSPAAEPKFGAILRDQIESGAVLGPRMFTSGPLIDLPGQVWSGSPDAVEVSTVEEVRVEVRRQVETGVDYVKLYAHLSPEMIRAGIEEAHGLGVKVIGHLGKTGWAAAAAMGIDAVTHSGTAAPTWELVPPASRTRFLDFFAPHQKPTFDSSLFGPWRELVDLEGPEMATFVSALAEHGVEINPTLVIVKAMFWGDDPKVLESFEPRHAPDQLANAWRGARHPYTVSWSDDTMAEAKKVFAINQEIVRRLHEAGVLITTGTDFPLPWLTPGVSLHREMELLNEAGIAPLDVLKMATSNGAQALGILDDVGTIEAGKRADIVVLDENPLADIGNTRKIEAVYLGGEVVDR